MFEDLLNDVIGWLEIQKNHGLRYVHLSDQTSAALENNPIPKKANNPFPQSTRKNQQQPFAIPSFSIPSQKTPSQRTAYTSSSFNPASMNTKIKIDLSTPLSPEEKVEKMNLLHKTVLQCTLCPHLAQSRKNIVFGIGDVNSPLMFIGEAPGADEDIQGEPFVGRAGQLLTKIIIAMGLSREKVFIANILKCRPDTPGQRSGNRPPTPKEMSICFPWLAKQIEIVQPKVIVALGATAVNGLLMQSTPISRLRGHFQPFHGIQVMPTFHPSYLLRYASNHVKRQVWEDMLQVMNFLKYPISEKQQNYFLPKN